MTILHYHLKCQLREAQKKQEVKLMHRSQKFPSWINYSRLEMNFPSYKKKKTPISIKFNFALPAS